MEDGTIGANMSRRVEELLRPSLKLPSLESLLHGKASHTRQATRFSAVSQSVPSANYNNIDMITAALEIQGMGFSGSGKTKKSRKLRAEHNRAQRSALQSIYTTLDDTVAGELKGIITHRGSDSCSSAVRNSTLAAKATLYRRLDSDIDSRLLDATRILTSTGYAWDGAKGKAARVAGILSEIRSSQGGLEFEEGSYNADLLSEMQEYVTSNKILSTKKTGLQTELLDAFSKEMKMEEYDTPTFIGDDVNLEEDEFVFYGKRATDDVEISIDDVVFCGTRKDDDIQVEFDNTGDDVPYIAFGDPEDDINLEFAADKDDDIVITDDEDESVIKVDGVYTEKVIVEENTSLVDQLTTVPELDPADWEGDEPTTVGGIYTTKGEVEIYVLPRDVVESSYNAENSLETLTHEVQNILGQETITPAFARGYLAAVKSEIELRESRTESGKGRARRFLDRATAFLGRRSDADQMTSWLDQYLSSTFGVEETVVANQIKYVDVTTGENGLEVERRISTDWDNLTPTQFGVRTLVEAEWEPDEEEQLAVPASTPVMAYVVDDEEDLGLENVTDEGEYTDEGTLIRPMPTEVITSAYETEDTEGYEPQETFVFDCDDSGVVLVEEELDPTLAGLKPTEAEISIEDIRPAQAKTVDLVEAEWVPDEDEQLKRPQIVLSPYVCEERQTLVPLEEDELTQTGIKVAVVEENYVSGERPTFVPLSSEEGLGVEGRTEPVEELNQAQLPVLYRPGTNLAPENNVPDVEVEWDLEIPGLEVLELFYSQGGVFKPPRDSEVDDQLNIRVDQETQLPVPYRQRGALPRQRGRTNSRRLGRDQRPQVIDVDHLTLSEQRVATNQHGIPGYLRQHRRAVAGLGAAALGAALYFFGGDNPTTEILNPTEQETTVSMQNNSEEVMYMSSDETRAYIKSALATQPSNDDVPYDMQVSDNLALGYLIQNPIGSGTMDDPTFQEDSNGLREIITSGFGAPRKKYDPKTGEVMYKMIDGLWYDLDSEGNQIPLMTKHGGTDFSLQTGTPIRAARYPRPEEESFIACKGQGGPRGNHVEVTGREVMNGDVFTGVYGVKDVYMHLDQFGPNFFDEDGSEVDCYELTFQNKDDPIGTGGNTGRSSGPHLHYQASNNNVAQNPLNLIVKPLEREIDLRIVNPEEIRLTESPVAPVDPNAIGGGYGGSD